MLSEIRRRIVANRYAWKMINKPYIWTGDDPLRGFDCSGLVIEILRAVNLLPEKGDWTADILSTFFPQVQIPYGGCLIFFHNSEMIRFIHVEYCIDDELSIGASGGGSKTLTIQDAINSNAFVKVRPIGTPALITDPFKMKPGWWKEDARFK